jgi:hypothetical protein
MLDRITGACRTVHAGPQLWPQAAFRFRGEPTVFERFVFCKGPGRPADRALFGRTTSRSEH